MPSIIKQTKSLHKFDCVLVVRRDCVVSPVHYFVGRIILSCHELLYPFFCLRIRSRYLESTDIYLEPVLFCNLAIKNELVPI